MAPIYQSQVLDHLGLVAAMYEELGSGTVIDHTIAQDTTKRTVSRGQAVKAMGLNGLGFVNQQLYLVPSFFHNKPTARLIGPGIEAAHLNDDVLGRALEALYGYGVTPLYSLIAAQAAQCLGLTAQFAHLDTTSFHVDGRYNSAAAPDEQVIHITPGYSRDHRPDLNQVMLELIVEQYAGIPLLMKPLSGNTNEQVEFGRIITAHVQQLRTAHPLTYLVADSALYTAENLGRLAQSGLKWITRVPATLAEVHAVLARVTPETMPPLADGYRYQEEVVTYREITQRWMVVYSEARQQRSRRTVEKQLRTQSEAELKAFKHLRRTPFACAAAAQQALEAFTQALQVTRLEGGRIRMVTRYGKRGRPPAEPSSRHVEYVIEGALASSLAYRQALLDTKSCFILATNELDTTVLPAADVLAGDKKQSTAERGFRFLKAPRFLATALYLKKPERIMALLMVMTICLLGYAALEYRLRQALHGQQETFPDQKGQPVQTPTMRWIFHYFVGIHVLLGAEAAPLVLNLNAHHQLVLRLLGAAYEALYS
jgi:transposase